MAGLQHGDRVVHQATPADQGTVLAVFDGEVTVLWDSNRGFGEFTETHPEDSVQLAGAVHLTIETPCPPPGEQDAPEQRSTT